MGKKSREKWERRAEESKMSLAETKKFWAHLKKWLIMRDFLGRKQQGWAFGGKK